MSHTHVHMRRSGQKRRYGKRENSTLTINGARREAQFALKQVEPNSGLGKAITYLLRHWKGLTAFLREAGAPLDNNICERALKPRRAAS